MELEDPPVLAKPATSCPVQALWPKLQARWRRQSAVRRLAYVGAVAVAPAVALTVSLVPPPWYHRPAPMNVAAGSLPAGEHWQPMRQVTPSPLSAQVALVRDGTGTRIEMWCSYPVYGDDADDSAAAPYALRIGTRTGQSIIASSWTAKPGSTLMTSTTVPMAQDQIESIQVIDNHGDASPLVFLELHR
ncbi:anti-sigma factor, partial [Staphylococcus capitis]|nr:anti-sigma factor [Staphylococcus capitis]